MRRDIHVQDAPPLVRQDHQDEQHAEGRRRDREEVSVGDNCSGPVTCEIVAVASSEPVDGLGDGDTAPDWAITGPLSVSLRADRLGTRKGRVYAIALRCTDAAGNVSTRTTTVAVPRDP